jgi:DivIVA domain-containing protein
MRLTPAEVHNVAFKKPSIGKRGYDEDEVDAFLDIVEDELARLIEENKELTKKLADYETGGKSAPAEEAAAPAAVEQAAEATAPAPAPTPAPQSTGEIHVQAARLLGLAQETADKLTAEAKQEADTTLSAARTESERLLAEANSESERLRTEAQEAADKLRTDAQTESDALVNDAVTKADSTQRESEARALALTAEAQQKYDTTMGDLAGQRTELEKKIEGLRVYEREYRSRLRSWISDQLSQLDTDAGAGEAPTSDAEPAPADL